MVFMVCTNSKSNGKFHEDVFFTPVCVHDRSMSINFVNNFIMRLGIIIDILDIQLTRGEYISHKLNSHY